MQTYENDKLIATNIGEPKELAELLEKQQSEL
ncbi:hypothetical protein LCGC14_2714630, partial [marine sediment metagenome]